MNLYTIADSCYSDCFSRIAVQNTSHRVLFTLCLLAACLTQFASDIYAPSIPSIAHSLQTEISHVQWSMAVYLFGVALSLLVYGPLSEGFGRRRPMLVGLGIMALGSLLAGLSTSIWMLIGARFIQGCGAGAASGLWGAIFRDVFDQDAFAKYSSQIAIYIMFSLSLAPAIGGVLQDEWGWRSTFGLVFVYTLITFFAMLALYRETSRVYHKDRLCASFIKAGYKELATHRVFMGITLCNFLSYGAYFSLFVVSPVLLIHVAKLSATQFGLIMFAGSCAAYLLAGTLNSRYVKRLGGATMLRFGWACMGLSGLLMLILPLAFGISGWSIAAPMILCFFGSTFIWPNAFSIALQPFPHIAGYAGVSYRFMLLAGGAIIGSLIAYLPHFTAIPLACVLIACTALAWIVYERMVL